MHTRRAWITGSLVYLCVGLDGGGDKSRALDARAWRGLMKPAVCSMMELRGGVCSELICVAPGEIICVGSEWFDSHALLIQSSLIVRW
jgi:hypothetical protein